MFFTRNKKIIAFTLLCGVMFVGALSPVATVEAQNITQIIEKIAGNVNPLGANFGCGNVTGLGASGILSCGVALVHHFVTLPAITVAGWGATLLNIVFYKLVVGMGTIVNGTSAITQAWGILRDIANVFLVFLLVYVGIATILGISGYGYKQLLWRIVLAALLVNFSITFTKLIIDVSNMFAIETFNQIVAAPTPSPTWGNPTSPYGGLVGCGITSAGIPDPNQPATEHCYDNGITGAFISALKATKTFDFQAVINANPNTNDVDLLKTMLISSVMTAIMFIVMAFVFIAGAFLLIGRFVILIFLLIISPFALVLWVTKVSSAGSKWWHALLNQAFFAPLLYLMWYIAYLIAGGVNGNNLITPANAPSLSVSGVPTPINVMAIVTFAIIIAFLIAGIVVAKKFGAYGASGAMNIGKRWSRRSAMMVGAGAGALTAGAGGRLARAGVGRGSAAYANSKAMQDQLASSNKMVRGLAKAQLAASQRLSKSSFDPRALSKSKVLGKPAGKGGFNKWAEGKAKREKEINEVVGKETMSHTERKGLNKKLESVNAEYDMKKRKAEKPARDAENELAIAKKIKDKNYRKTAMKAAKDKLKKARQDIKQTRSSLDAERITKRREVHTEQMKEMKITERSNARKQKDIERMGSERKFGVLPTPRWKREQADKLRKGKSKEKEFYEKVVKDAKDKIKEEDAPTPSPTPEETSSESTTT